MPSFKKSLIVEQFQGKYLNVSEKIKFISSSHHEISFLLQQQTYCLRNHLWEKVGSDIINVFTCEDTENADIR